MIAKSALLPFTTLSWTFPILSAVSTENIIQPIEPKIMVHTAFANAISVIGSTPSCTPTASVPNPTAISSNIIDPIYDNLIHAIGPPTDTNKAKRPVNITMDGPTELMRLLLIAPFICFSVNPIVFPAENDFFANNIA